MRNKIKSIIGISTPPIKVYVVAASLVLLSSLTVTFWTWNNARTSLNNDIKTTLANGVDGAAVMIASKAGTYTEVLDGVAGLFQAVENVDEEAYRNYVNSLSLDDSYPGLQAIVYSQIEADKISVKYIEPLNARNQKVIGFNTYSEPARRKAMDAARDTGNAAITSRVILAADSKANDPEPGFIIFQPIYARNAPLDSIGERRAAIIGYVSAGVRSHELIDGLFSKSLTKDSGLLVYDGLDQTTENIIYKSASYNELSRQSSLVTKSSVIELGSNQWTMVASVNSNIATSIQRNQPKLILIIGVVFSVMLSGLLLILMINRARSIAVEKGLEVQAAKDGLISLASHQLRTPATSVKQFIGMVLEGYAGKVPIEQRRFLKKAYASNERQLEIINQILHVTRADSGRLVLHKKRTNLTQLVKTVVAEHAQPVQARNQKVIFKQPKKIMANVDPQYLAMAIDNLLSNASKYSGVNKTILVNLDSKSGGVRISVKDSGVGISEEDMHMLFQKFSRIDNELSIEAGGNGIGLYLCQQIVTLHDGSIEVISEPGKGSTFIISLPK